MIRLAQIVERYREKLLARFGAQLTDEHRRALYAIQGCRTDQYGSMVFQCQQCHWQTTLHHSCGHRACPQCQNHDTSLWLDRQMKKQMPVDYFMVTFTLPKPLRQVAQKNPREVFGLMMQCASTILQTFAKNDRDLQGRLGFTSVLHTHSRRLDFHPHVHVLIPGGAINKRHKLWRTKKDRYLFNHKALAKVFRARLLRALYDERVLPSQILPAKWVVDCQHMGTGAPALKYLSRYLYRGVISEKYIINDDGESVRFKYKHSKSKKMKTRTEKGEVFLWLLLQHVLPKGFRRSRDYGFLHGNAKQTLAIVQWVLKVNLTVFIPREVPSRPLPVCRCCGQRLHLSSCKFKSVNSS